MLCAPSAPPPSPARITENILSHHTYTTESTKKLLAALENGRVLADFIDVAPAYERAAEEFLHDELEYVVVKDWAEAERSMNILRTDLEGRATFLVEGHVPDTVVKQALACGLPRLSSFVSFTNGLTGQTQNLPRLARCYLASDRDQARAMAEAHPRLISFFRMASPTTARC